MPELTIDGRRVSYRREGQGPRVIALHCSSSHSGQWKPLVEQVCDRFEIVAPDLAGYGRSAPLARDEPWFAQDRRMVAALADGAPVHLVGHSLGGALAFHATKAGETDVRSVALIEPVLYPLLDEAAAPEAAEGWWCAATVLGLLRLGLREAAAEAFVGYWSGPDAWAATAPHVRDYVLATVDRVGDDWAGMAAGLEEQATLGDARDMSLPVLLMRGSETRASAAMITELLADALPDVRVIELEGAAHMAAVTRPDLVMPRLVDWLDEQQGRG